MGSSLALGCCSSASEGLDADGPEAEEPPCAEEPSSMELSGLVVHGLWPGTDAGCPGSEGIRILAGKRGVSGQPVDGDRRPRFNWRLRQSRSRLRERRAACGALTAVDANALASDNVVKILLPPGAVGGTRPVSCVEGAAPGRTWDEKGACMKENEAAAGGRKRGSAVRLAKVGGVANEGDELTPRASVEGAGNAKGVCNALSYAMVKSPMTVLLDCEA